MTDTIVAISTAMGVGAISIIRMSGKDSIKIINKVFKEKNLEKVNSHTINYGHIVENTEIIDEVLVTIMKSPKTFTTEDVVEINCHGGIIITNKILELLLINGARLAEPGEFTKRAFLNGRIDLVEAEAISDLINVKSEKSRKLAINQLEGNVSRMIKDLRGQILNLLASIEVNIDYPEYKDIEEMTLSKTNQKLLEIKEKLLEIVNESENGKIIKDGIKTIIVGRPNVGKSSLLNKLIDEEKAIVTDIAGTTRDIVEGEVRVNGILLNIIDTAGIRSTNDIVEKIGVEKSLALIDEADLVIVVLNNNEQLTKEDKLILDKTKDKTSIVVINKNDLNSNIDKQELENRIIVYTNTLSNEGIINLKDKIKELFNLEQLDKSDYNYLSNSRQIALIKKSLEYLNNALEGLNDEIPLDMIELDIKCMWDTLGEIIGQTYQEELLDQLFSQFCLGK